MSPMRKMGRQMVSLSFKKALENDGDKIYFIATTNPMQTT